MAASSPARSDSSRPSPSMPALEGSQSPTSSDALFGASPSSAFRRPIPQRGAAVDPLPASAHPILSKVSLSKSTPLDCDLNERICAILDQVKTLLPHSDQIEGLPLWNRLGDHRSFTIIKRDAATQKLVQDDISLNDPLLGDTADQLQQFYDDITRLLTASQLPGPPVAAHHDEQRDAEPRAARPASTPPSLHRPSHQAPDEARGVPDVAREIERFREQFEQFQYENRQLREEIETINARHDRDTAGLRDEVRRLTEESNTLRDQLERARAPRQPPAAAIQPRSPSPQHDSQGSPDQPAPHEEGADPALQPPALQPADPAELQALQEALAEKERRIRELEEQLHQRDARHAEERTRLQEEFRRQLDKKLEAIQQRHDQELSSLRERIDELTSANAALSARNAELEQTISALQRRNEEISARLRTLIPDSQEILDELTAKMKEKQEELNSLRKEKQNLIQDRNLARERAQKLHQQLEKTQQQLETASAQLVDQDSLQRQLKDQEALIQQQQDAIAQLQERLETQEKQYQEFERASLLEAEIRQIAERDLQKKLSDLLADLRKKETELREKTKDLEEGIGRSLHRAGALWQAREIARKEQELDEARKLIRELERTLERERQEQARQLKDADLNIKSLQERLRALEQQLPKLQRFEKILRENTDLKDENHRLADQITRQNTQIAELQALIQAQNAELEALRSFPQRPPVDQAEHADQSTQLPELDDVPLPREEAPILALLPEQPRADTLDQILEADLQKLAEPLKKTALLNYRLLNSPEIQALLEATKKQALAIKRRPNIEKASTALTIEIPRDVLCKLDNLPAEDLHRYLGLRVLKKPQKQTQKKPQEFKLNGEGILHKIIVSMDEKTRGNIFKCSKFFEDLLNSNSSNILLAILKYQDPKTPSDDDLANNNLFAVDLLALITAFEIRYSPEDLRNNPSYTKLKDFRDRIKGKLAVLAAAEEEEGAGPA